MTETPEIQDDVIKKLIEEEAKKSAPQDDATNAAAQKTEPAQPMKINIAGQEYTFHDVNEISQAVNATLAAAMEKVRQAEARSSQQDKANSAGSYVQSDDEIPSLTTEQHAEFLNKMAKNPVEAMEYIDQIRFGIKETRPSKYIKERLSELEQYKMQNAVQGFKELHPEWPGGQAAQILDQYRTKLGLPFTAEGLSAAYASAQINGVLPPWTMQYRQRLQAQAQAGYQQGQAAQAGRQNQGGIPSLSTKGASAAMSGLGEDTYRQLEGMSPDQIKGLIDRLTNR